MLMYEKYLYLVLVLLIIGGTFLLFYARAPFNFLGGVLLLIAFLGGMFKSIWKY